MRKDHQRRKYPRIRTTIAVKLSTIDPEHDPRSGRPFFRSVRETCANVSRGGAFICTAERFRAGKRLLLEFDLPGGHQIETLGRVAWIQRGLPLEGSPNLQGVGIEFMGGIASQWKALDSVLEDGQRPVGRGEG